MDEEELRRAVHEAEVTVWVGKAGVGAVVEEFQDQLRERGVVKVKFLRSARGESETRALADELAGAAGAEVYDVRGHTAVFSR